jgi:hypothetical protein
MQKFIITLFFFLCVGVAVGTITNNFTVALLEGTEVSYLTVEGITQKGIF